VKTVFYWEPIAVYLLIFSIALLIIKKHLIQYGMWAVMKSYGMDQKLIRLIKAIYSETQLAVLFNGHLSEWFQTTVDNRQGVDPLSPRSFALFLERIMDKIKNRENCGVSVHGNRVNNLRFADDIDIIEQSNGK